jgi:hypothetical protein
MYFAVVEFNQDHCLAVSWFIISLPTPIICSMMFAMLMLQFEVFPIYLKCQ